MEEHERTIIALHGKETMGHEYDIERFRRWASREHLDNPYTPEEFDAKVESCESTDSKMLAAIGMAYSYNPVAASADPPWHGKKGYPSTKRMLEWWKSIATGNEGDEALREFANVRCSTCAHSIPVVWCCPNNMAMMPDAHGLYSDPYKCHYVERKEG